MSTIDALRDFPTGRATIRFTGQRFGVEFNPQTLVTDYDGIVHRAESAESEARNLSQKMGDLSGALIRVAEARAADSELLDRVRRFAQTPTAGYGAESDIIRGFNAGEAQTLKRLREILGIEEPT